MNKEPEGYTVIDRVGVDPGASLDIPTAYDKQSGDHYCDPDEYNEQSKHWKNQ